jgi:DNA-binding response OmpR family regulator
MANIIIVEDDLKLAEAYKKRLEEDGHKVEIIDDTSAYEVIKSQKPNVVLLDLLMPKVSGMTILRELKSDAELEGIPVLILTNVEGTNELSQAITLGASAYLVKAETNIDLLSAKIKEVLESEAIATGVKG